MFPKANSGASNLSSCNRKEESMSLLFPEGRAILGKKTSITKAVGQEDVCGREASLTAEHNKKQTRSPGSSGMAQ